MSARPVPTGIGRLRRASAARPRGPRSIFAKGLRDSRRAVLLAGLGLGAVVLLVAGVIAEQFPAAADRRQLVAEFRLLPAALSGLLGTPINIDRLGGFISWRLGNFMPVMLGIWSVLALSGTLAGEARAGNLEALAATPFSRRHIALEKVAAHLAGLAVAAALIGLAGWLAGLVFGRLEGDTIALGDSLAHFAGVALLGLVAGALAFGLGPIVGRANAAGISIAVLLAAFLVNAYASVIPAFEQVQGSSWFAWTANQRPIAGTWDALSLVPVVTLVVAFLALGVVAFERRDLGATVRLPSIVLPGRRLGLRGPASQALASRVPVALAWGVGIGVWAWLIALASRDFATRFGSDPAITRLIEQIFSGVPWRTPSGFLQLFFFSFAVMILGLAAAAMVSGVAAEERERRLELPLSTPVSRARWTVGNGVGVFGALAIVTLVVALFAAAGASAGGQDPVQPFIGAWVGGLYAAGLAGVGLAVVGLGAVDLGAPVTAALAIGFLLWDVIGSALRLPPEILDLTLTRHLGRPMIGTYDWPGMLILAAMVVGGLLVAVWGMRRRDVAA